MAKRMSEKIDGVADGLLTGLGAALVMLILVSIFCRYVLNRSLVWSDEVVRYLFVWFTLFGGAVALREREHIRVEYFVEKLPGVCRRRIECAMLSGVCAFQAALVVLGLMWVRATRGSYTSALQWPLNLFFYAALPTTSSLGVWYALRRLLRGEYAENDVAAEELSDALEGGPSCNS
jgi:TRAP-type C4-dicarboxylate transport system permease small subunit